MKPVVSIVVPVYKAEDYIEHTISTIQNQTLKDIEIIAVNDGSPDRSGAILDQKAISDGRIRVFHKQNGGYGTAVNAGIECATGEYIGIVEADDYVEPDMFLKLVKQAQSGNLDISRCSFAQVLDQKQINITTTLGSEIGIFNINEYPEFLVTPPAIWSAIYRLDFINQHRHRIIDVQGISYQDVDFFVRTAVTAQRIQCSKEALYNYRLDNPGSSTNHAKKVNDVFICYEITDRYIAEANLQQRVKDFYQKRKICDFLWHFNRLKNSPKSRVQFATIASKQVRKITNTDFLPLLDKSQARFYRSVSRFPKSYSALKRIQELLGNK